MDYLTSVPSITSYTPATTTNIADIGALGAIIGAIFAAFAVVFVIFGILAVLTTVARWFLFKKANRKPWEAIIPIHCDIVEMEMGGLETYWFFLNFTTIIPIVGFAGPLVWMFWKNIQLAKAFERGAGTGVLLTFFPYIMYPVLAWGSAKYVGPEGTAKTTNAKSKEK